MGTACSSNNKAIDKVDSINQNVVVAHCRARYGPVIYEAMEKNRLLAAYFREKNLTYEVKHKLIELMTFKDLEKDDVLCRLGEESNHLYVVIKGELRVVDNGVTIGKINVNECAGEIGFLNGNGRSASLLAQRRTTIAVLDLADFMQHTEMVCLGSSAFERIPVLAQLNPAALKWLASAVTLQKYGPGEVIVRKGDAPSNWYIMATGYVSVDEGLDSSNHLIKIGGLLGPNCYFCEESILLSKAERYNVVAHHETSCYVMPLAVFRHETLAVVRKSLRMFLAEDEPSALNMISPTSASAEKKKVFFAEDTITPVESLSGSEHDHHLAPRSQTTPPTPPTPPQPAPEPLSDAAKSINDFFAPIGIVLF